MVGERDEDAVGESETVNDADGDMDSVDDALEEGDSVVESDSVDEWLSVLETVPEVVAVEEVVGLVVVTVGWKERETVFPDCVDERDVDVVTVIETDGEIDMVVVAEVVSVWESEMVGLDEAVAVGDGLFSLKEVEVVMACEALMVDCGERVKVALTVEQMQPG